MRSQLRLKVILPVALVGVLGVGLAAFTLNKNAPAEGESAEAGTPAVGSPAKPKQLTAADWIKQVNALCVRDNKQLEALGRPNSPDELAVVVPTLIEVASRFVLELEALGQPTGAAADAQSVLALNRNGLGSLEELERALGAGDVRALVRLDRQLAGLDAKSDRLALRLGLTDCAADPFAGEAKSLSARIERSLRKHSVVVLVVYSPRSPVDSLTTREARVGANAAGAGFLAVNVARERDVKALADRYGLVDSPAVLVLVPYKGIVTRIDGYADRETVAQAAENASS